MVCYGAAEGACYSIVCATMYRICLAEFCSQDTIACRRAGARASAGPGVPDVVEAAHHASGAAFPHGQRKGTQAEFPHGLLTAPGEQAMRTLVTHSLKAKCFDAGIHFVGLHALYDLGSEAKSCKTVMCLRCSCRATGAACSQPPAGTPGKNGCRNKIAAVLRPRPPKGRWLPAAFWPARCGRSERIR